MGRTMESEKFGKIKLRVGDGLETDSPALVVTRSYNLYQSLHGIDGNSVYLGVNWLKRLMIIKVNKMHEYRPTRLLHSLLTFS